MKTSSVALAALAGMVLGAVGMHTLHAQQSGIQRALLQKIDLAPGTASLEAVLGTAEIPAGVAAGRHTHAGVEIGYVLSGEARMEIAREPARALKTGDSYAIAAGRPHDAVATGAAPAKVVACYVVEKGKPLASSAP